MRKLGHNLASASSSSRAASEAKSAGSPAVDIISDEEDASVQEAVRSSDAEENDVQEESKPDPKCFV